jgi:predicted DNA-binding protein (MmcQ/YjbR family)
MNAASTQVFLLSLRHVVETVSETTRWGNKLVYRAGDQAIGGKMFAQIDFEYDGRDVLSFAAGSERFYDLIERDRIIPAPYRARPNWVALERWSAISDPELQELLRAAVALTFAKLPKRTREQLNGPE